MQLTRREFITCGLSAVLTATGIFYATSKYVFSVPQSLLSHISPAFYDVKLGTLFLNGPLQGIDGNELCKRLNSKLSWYPPAIYGISDSTVRAAIRHDYKKDMIMVIDGWVLPETAVYLSALAALEQHNVH